MPPISSGQRAAQRRIVLRRQSARTPPGTAPGPAPPLPELGNRGRALTMILPPKRLFQLRADAPVLAKADTTLELRPAANRTLRRTIATAAPSGGRHSRFSAPATQVVRYSLDLRSGAKQLISDSDASKANSLPAGHG